MPIARLKMVASFSNTTTITSFFFTGCPFLFPAIFNTNLRWRTPTPRILLPINTHYSKRLISGFPFSGPPSCSSLLLFPHSSTSISCRKRAGFGGLNSLCDRADGMGPNNRPEAPLMQSPSVQDCQEPCSKLLTLPTVLTLARIAAVPLLVSTFYVDTWWGRTATAGIFIAAAITDWLDGYLARKLKLRSAFGAFLDPVADKLMVAVTLILFCSSPVEVKMFGEIPWLLTVPAITIISREIAVSALREWAASQNSKFLEATAVNNLGKWKTATQMIALITLLATRDSSVGGAGIFLGVGIVLLYLSAVLSVWSFAVYMTNIRRILLK